VNRDRGQRRGEVVRDRAQQGCLQRFAFAECLHVCMFFEQSLALDRETDEARRGDERRA
jgi:hypothetical protein